MFPKDANFRSEAWRRAVASLPCVVCSRDGESQAAHVNHIGKGMSLKAPDCWTFPACVDCHRAFDQGQGYTKEQRRELAERWVMLTVHELAKAGLLKVKL